MDSRFRFTWLGQRVARLGLGLPLLVLPPLLLSGCGLFTASKAQAPGGGDPPGRDDQGPVAVKTIRAETGSLSGQLAYTGTTRPAQQVALRTQLNGEVIDLSADAGDLIDQGSVLAQLDGNLQITDLGEAEAELAARRSEAAQAQVAISDAQAVAVNAQATLDQARLDASRLRGLADQGGISLQAAEASELAVVNAQQALQSAQAQVASRRQAAASAASRIEAQQAVVAQQQNQLSDTDVRSPISGVVLSRQVDIGSYVESGATLFELGDLGAIKVTVQVSELDLAQLSLDQPAQVTLDAFSGEGSILGRITQIAPLADATSRLLPVEVTIPNLNGQIGSGLLARVQFGANAEDRVVVPTSALEIGEDDAAVYVVEGEGDAAKAIARPVRIGEQDDDRVEILSGLAPDEAFIVQSDRLLTSGQAVRLSILSDDREQSPN